MEVQYKFERISDNVYAFIQPNGDWFLSNAGVIIGKNYAIVVDSLTNEKMTKQFISEIRKVTDKPIKYLINTHEHEDHLWTNHLFPNAITICHKNCREKVVEGMKRGSNPYEKLFSTIDFSGYKYTPQEVVIDDEMRIFIDDDEVRIAYVGYAHTISDIYVYVPNKKVVFTGDLLFSPPCTPFALMGYIQGYINTLENLANLNAEVYVPGHGEVSYDRKTLYESRDYLIFVRDEARKLMKNIDDPIRAAYQVNLGKYEEWISKERIIGNLARAYSELKGNPPASKLENIDKILVEMVKYRKRKVE
ncbi:MBL fold metallo-hydrolase [Saccharolobus islandicus]|uniref:Zn-dependent hydrolase, including glyoxylase n=3 Tax=Saccharolobus islandicus TaxID=43080 RepID=M9UC71_SACIS|nr:MBL fold metallo-hydrolase [Sulfolobus islandicus]ADX81686.1 beta-lactamase domain protein [Sulfolobus islandicus HVE10/4]ADX84407.1 beta-lactamase domain protein [Sulfolobus islandicus REY15A]AGJ61775.1 Zn-dependent hydrolase, including glyoxylase [Sulfolobus islandicus LAL14/1]WCM36942.1 MBL fold metallo-hydrolase [Sulfolobus islandicus]